MLPLNGQPVHNFSNYLALESGQIFSTKSNKILKPFISGQGYEVVSFSVENLVSKHLVHRLIAQTLIENSDPSKIWVNHKDGIKTNNSVHNLEWVTPSQNNLHSYKLGLNVAKKGEDHFASKLSNAQVAEIKLLLEQGYFYKQIAKLYNVSTSLIGSINRKERRAS